MLQGWSVVAVSLSSTVARTPATNDMPARASAYVVGVVAVGMLLVAVSMATLRTSHWLTVGLLALMHVLASKLSEHKHHAATDSHLALGSVIVLAALSLVGPAGAIIVAAADFVAEDRTRALHKRAFNAATLVVATATAGPLMIATGATTHGLTFSFPSDLIPVLVADLALYAMCAVMVGVAVALTSSSNQRLVAAAGGIRAPAALLELGNGFLGLGLAVLWGPAGIGPFSAVLVTLPLYLAGFSYSQVAEEQQAYDRTVAALGRAVETKDVYTRGHSERVAKASVLLGRQLRFNEARVGMLRYAGMLHDIGKIGVPSRVLQKPGRLTEEEFDAIKLHPECGLELVSGIEFLEEAHAGIAHHHERIDGLGYPAGLRGDQIPEFARIIAVADAFDSMTSTRSYRGPCSVDDAIAELRRCEGTQFDPVNVAALVRALERTAWEPAGGADELVDPATHFEGHYPDGRAVDLTESREQRY